MTKKKIAIAIAAAALAGTCAIGGTLAWLTATTDEVTNTFTVGNIQMTLDETNINDPSAARVTSNSYTSVMPGDTYIKDPTVHIAEGSEPCYVYVEVVDTTNGAVQYKIDTANWTKVENTDNIYRYNSEVDAGNEAKTLPSIFVTETEGSEKYNITINSTLDAASLAALENQTITVNAYAHQSENVEQTAADTAATTYFAQN